MTFANYDRLLGPDKTPYGHKANTLMVKFTRDFRPVQSWTLPEGDARRFEEMSNSGGSWGRTATCTSPATIRPRCTGCGSQSRLGAGAGRDHPGEHPRPGHRLGSLAAGRHLRDHPRDAKESADGGNNKVTVFRMGEKK